MKTLKFLITSIILFAVGLSQTETDMNASVDSAAKVNFGIQINWGIYSIPAWAPKNVDIRQYQYVIEHGTNPEIMNFHKRNYGAHFSYYNFADQFKGHMFNAENWVNIVSKSGAGYIVFSAKSNDGFCLWPNEQADDRGFPWNRAALASKRDFIGEFTNAIRKTNLKFGVSFSLDEPFHPMAKSDKNQFYSQHILPQLKDLLLTYRPDLFLLQNRADFQIDENDLKDFLKIKPDAMYTSEHYSLNSFQLKKFNIQNHQNVVNIGLTSSMAYNQNDNFLDYLAAESIVLVLTDVASRGKSLLLNIGADGAGKIPPIVQERMVSVGKWLAINGEAIYKTEPWKNTCQWSLGKIDSSEYNTPDKILSTIKSNDRSRAKKEIIFTKKGTDLYAICPDYPGEELVVKNVELPDDGYVKFLATQQKPIWYNKDGNLHVKTPKFVPEILNNEMTYAYVFKLGNACKELKPKPTKVAPLTNIDTTKIAPDTLLTTKILMEPKITATYTTINAKPLISIDNIEKQQVFYTLDGSLPDTTSSLYLSPFTINRSARLKVMVKNYINGNDYFIEKYIKRVDEFVNFKLVYPSHKSFSGDGAITLCDGIYGDEEHASGKWLGFYGNDLIAEIELPSERFINSVTISALNKLSEDILFPTEFEIYTSLDNENFEYVKKMEIPKSAKEVSQQKFILEVPLQKAKAIRVFIKNYGQLPEKNDGQPKYAWLFIDEIEVR